jgi:lipopolysaccharide export system permease protein
MTPVLSVDGIRLTQVARMCLYIAPAFLEFAFPIAAFIAGLLVFHRLTADHEMAAMHASGWSFPYLLRPVWLFAGLIFLLTTLDILVALPWGNQSLQLEVEQILRNRGTLNIKPGIFFRDLEGLTLFYRERGKNGHLKNLFIAERTMADGEQIFLAEEGVLVVDPEHPRVILQMKNGKTHRILPSGDHYETTNFSSYNLNLSWPDLEQLMDAWLDYQGVIGNREESIPDLLKTIREREARNETAYYEEVILSRKFALIFSCLLFALTGPPLGMQSGKAGRYGAFIAGTAILFTYFLMLLLLQDMAYKGVIARWPAPWWPNLLLAGILFLVLRMALRDRSLWVDRN